MENPGDYMAFFQQRIQSLQSQRETSDALISDLMWYCQHVQSTLSEDNARLTKDLEETRLDLKDSTKSRRELQKLIEQKELQLDRVSNEHQSAIRRNPYVTVLIDGDGLIFQDRYIRQGLEGGKRAAYALRTAVADQCNLVVDDIEVSAKIVANLRGLASALVRDSAIDNIEDLKNFTLGFTQAKASFDFVDVGYGKERADSKIRENTRWHLQNQNCKHIVLGISHDAGYAPFLDEILRDDSTRKRVTLLEGTPTVRELRATDVKIWAPGDDLFRTEKLTDRVAANLASLDRATPTSVNTSPSTTSSRPVHPAITPPASNHTTSPFSSYAGAAVKTKPASPPPQLSVPLAPQSGNAGPRSKATGATKWNPGPRGLDSRIELDAAALDSVRKRKDNNKLCNNHFLRGPCAKGDSCSFVHKARPTQKELDAILHLSRWNPCQLGQDCEADDCIYGHHCQSMNMKELVCAHPFCKFPEDAHPEGTKYKNAYVDKNY